MAGLFAGTPLEQPVTCERCGKPHATCICPRGRDGKVLNPKDQPVRVRREKRGGKMVTVAAGFAPRSSRTDDLPDLLSQLKKKMATGGKVDSDGGEIELQGDHRDKIVALLIGMGYPAKAAGG
jgi:translation initiation factor 1